MISDAGKAQMAEAEQRHADARDALPCVEPDVGTVVWSKERRNVDDYYIGGLVLSRGTATRHRNEPHEYVVVADKRPAPHRARPMPEYTVIRRRIYLDEIEAAATLPYTASKTSGYCRAILSMLGHHGGYIGDQDLEWLDDIITMARLHPRNQMPT